MFVLANVLGLLLASDPFCAPAPYLCALQFLGWKSNVLIVQGQYWRLFTAMFLHSDIFHLLMNGFALYILGPDTERIYGTGRFLGLYFLAGLTGSLASYAFNPSPSVGASGAIFGLFGGVLIFFLINRQFLGSFGRSQLQGLLMLLAINLFLGFTSARIDNLGHIGGLLGGLAIGWLLLPRYSVDRSSFTPHLVQRKNPLAWAGAAVWLVGLAVLTILVIPPLQ
jgi:rhomboid protease GluP